MKAESFDIKTANITTDNNRTLVLPNYRKSQLVRKMTDVGIF